MLNTFYDLLVNLSYGKNSALTAEELKRKLNDNSSLDHFKRKLRHLANEGRKAGHKIIGDDNGYYLALNNDEWNQYKLRRFSAFADELNSFASIEKITIADLIKNIYHVNVKNENFELF